MATVTRVNGIFEMDVDYNFTNIKKFRWQISGSDTSWQADEVNPGRIVDILATRYQPLRIMTTTSGNNLYVLMWLQGESYNADDLQTELRDYGTLGANDIDVSSGLVAEMSFVQ